MGKQIGQNDCDFAMSVVRHAMLMGLTLEQLNKLIVAAWGVLDVSSSSSSAKESP